LGRASFIAGRESVTGDKIIGSWQKTRFRTKSRAGKGNEQDCCHFGIHLSHLFSTHMFS